MSVMGIDPGVKGALALIDPVACTVAVIDMPLEAGTKGKDTVSATGVVQAIRAANPDAVFLEKVSASPQMGVTSAFSFGEGFGVVKAGSLALGSSLWLPRPQEWKSQTKTPKDKKQATTRASQIVPSCHKLFYGPRGGAFDGRAEAVLLAFYGCLVLKQVPTRPLTLIDFPEAS